MESDEHVWCLTVFVWRHRIVVVVHWTNSLSLRLSEQVLESDAFEISNCWPVEKLMTLSDNTKTLPPQYNWLEPSSLLNSYWSSDATMQILYVIWPQWCVINMPLPGKTQCHIRPTGWIIEQPAAREVEVLECRKREEEDQVPTARMMCIIDSFLQTKIPSSMARSQ